MTLGHWYSIGRHLMNSGVTLTTPGAGTIGPFTWNGSTTNYALYAALVNSGTYTPNTAAPASGGDEYLSTAIASSAEPAAATGYLRVPVQLADIAMAQKTGPTANYDIYPANASYPLSWTVNAGQTLTAGLIVFYWDMNVKNSLVSPLTSYYPSGTNNTYDASCPLIAYGPFIDSTSAHNYWTTTTLPALVGYTYDTSFSGYSTILSSQVL